MDGQCSGQSQWTAGHVLAVRMSLPSHLSVSKQLHTLDCRLCGMTCFPQPTTLSKLTVHTFRIACSVLAATQSSSSPSSPYVPHPTPHQHPAPPSSKSSTPTHLGHLPWQPLVQLLVCSQSTGRWRGGRGRRSGAGLSGAWQDDMTFASHLACMHDELAEGFKLPEHTCTYHCDSAVDASQQCCGTLRVRKHMINISSVNSVLHHSVGSICVTTACCDGPAHTRRHPRDRYHFLLHSISTSRVWFAFAVDAALYAVWQAAMLSTVPTATPFHKFVPFFGLAAHLLQTPRDRQQARGSK